MEHVHQDLEFIRSVMENARKRRVVDGIHSMIWGTVVPICTALSFWLAEVQHPQFISLLWVLGMIFGALCSFIAGYIRTRRWGSLPSGAGSQIYYSAWIAFGIGVVGTMVAGMLGLLEIPESLFMLAMLLAVTNTVDASFCSMNWLYFITAGWFVVAFFVLLLPMPHAAMFFGFSTIPLQWLPGWILTRIYRREIHGEI